MFDINRDDSLSIIKCLVQEDENISRIYGFILYSSSHPYVVKLLRSNDYWNALDNISGRNWPIFAVRPKDKVLNEDIPLNYMMDVGSSKSSLNDITFSIQQDFNITDEEQLPCFVVFMWDDQDNLQEIIVPISGDSIESVYKTIAKIVKSISDVESGILPEYKKTVNVFREVKKELDGQDFRSSLINRGKDIQNFMKLFNFFKIFTSL